MGVFCKISVVQPQNNEFYPGSEVRGTIKYDIDKNTIVKRIQLSLKGTGCFQIFDGRLIYEESEKYVDLQNTVFNDNGEKQFGSQHYDTSFNFVLPKGIPGSLKYEENARNHFICEIKYYIVIEFEVEGFLKFNKKFKKDIKVVPTLTPELSMEPIIYATRKDVFQLFNTNKNVINLKACVKRSVLQPGEKIEISYELNNDSNKTIKAVESKLVTVYKFYGKGKLQGKELEDIKNTDSKTGAIEKGGARESQIEINVPSDLYCINDSKLVSKEYGVLIIVQLPLPQKNMELFIPIQIGKMTANLESNKDYCSDPGVSPPSYWEVMDKCDGKKI